MKGNWEQSMNIKFMFSFVWKKNGQTKILFSSIVVVTTMNSFVIQKDFSFSFRQFIYLLLLLFIPFLNLIFFYKEDKVLSIVKNIDLPIYFLYNGSKHLVYIYISKQPLRRLRQGGKCVKPPLKFIQTASSHIPIS